METIDFNEPYHVQIVIGMADKTRKWSENAAGTYYVDEECIDCDACRAEAPDHFIRNDEHGYSFVSLQPVNDEEREKCEAALEACPVEAIGNDEESAQKAG